MPATDFLTIVPQHTSWFNRVYRWLSKSGQSLLLADLKLLVPPAVMFNLSAATLLKLDGRFAASSSDKIKALNWSQWRHNSTFENTEFVVFDIESTGSSLGRHEIFELGAVKIYGTEVVAEFHSHLSIKGRIPSFVAEITKVNFQAVNKAPQAEEVLQEFLRFSGSAVLVAHNSDFDYNLLYYEAHRLGLMAFATVDLCTWLLCQRLISKDHGFGLNDLFDYHHGNLAERHSALADAKMAGSLLIYCLKQLKTQGLTHLHELLAFEQNIFNHKYNLNRRLKKAKTSNYKG